MKSVKEFVSFIADAIKDDSKRISTAIILVIILIISLFINSLFVIWLIMGIAFAIAIFEALNLYKLEKDFYVITGLLLIWFLALFQNNPIFVGIFGLMLASVFSFKNQYKKTFLFLYPTLPFLALLNIYIINTYYLIWLIAVVALTDSLSYYGGKAFGKTPLNSVSPKKTMEGAAIGLTSAAIVGGFIGAMLFEGFFSSLFISLIIGLTSIIGDLFESYLKRSIEIKNSGNILPGHGGILDRIDGLLFGAVTMLFLIDAGA